MPLKLVFLWSVRCFDFKPTCVLDYFFQEMINSSSPFFKRIDYLIFLIEKQLEINKSK